MLRMTEWILLSKRPPINKLLSYQPETPAKEPDGWRSVPSLASQAAIWNRRLAPCRSHPTTFDLYTLGPSMNKRVPSCGARRTRLLGRLTNAILQARRAGSVEWI